jgi:hypothetical protein
MKCTKCGFVSFDYLSECKKCGVSLAGSRDALGFAGTKSNVPFFLGSLLKEYVKPSAADEKDLTAAASSQSFDFGFGDELDLAETLENMGPGSESQAAAPVSETVETEDLNLLDISDEELDILIAEDENQPVPGIGASGFAGEKESLIPKDLGVLPGLASNVSMPGVPVGSAGPNREDTADENLVIDLSDKDLENFLSELDDPSEQGSNDGSPGATKKPE